MLGLNLTLETLPEEGIGKKKKPWYEVHKFDNEDQYNEWRKWGEEFLLNHYEKPHEMLKVMNYIDLVYGMSYTIPKEEVKKEGQMELF